MIRCSLLRVKRPVEFTLYACACVCLIFPCVFTYHVNRELIDFVNIIFVHLLFLPNVDGVHITVFFASLG